MTYLSKQPGVRVRYAYRTDSTTVRTVETVYETGDLQRIAQQLQVTMNTDRTLLAPLDNDDHAKGFVLLPVTSLVNVTVEPLPERP